MINSILMISPEYPTETGIGGIGTYASYMARQFKKYSSDINVTVLSISYDNYKEYEEEGVKIIRLKVNRYSLIDRFIKYTVWIIKNYKKYDVIEDEVFGGLCFFAKLILGKKYKYIAHIHGTTYEVMVLEGFYTVLKRLKSEIINIMERYLCKNAKLVVFNSSITDIYVSFLWKLDLSVTHVFPYPFIDDKKKLVLSLPDVLKGREYFLFFGRVQKKKGSEVLKKLIPILLNKFPKIDFVFVGSDVVNMKGHFINNDRVLFIDFISDKSILYGIIKNAKVVILPSLFESFLYTAVESIIMGVPTILNNNCGVSQFLKQYDRYSNVVPSSNDVDMYVEAIGKLMEDYSTSLKYAKIQALSLKEKMSYKYVVGKYLAIINRHYD